ncbi:RND family efflux transporter, MFP subunit [Propionispira arboris]|uniref:RND family efflux transporter, MFP subunit n=1 Tax=Propionispira arboris TaxID=84035 RepID=A0A1H6XIX8_9FIRM|nr:efflux RND transporter periplasmic adaptor subunit [Propionispira arboris]SEJ29033.1 RND family efflux transporter, MFP subunit [Propionispira arboris]
MLIICIVIASLWYLHQKPKAVVEEPTNVQTTVIRSNATKSEYTYSGEVRGRYESQLAFQVSGKIIRRNVEVGSTVNAGDVLMEIDPKDIQQTVNSTLAQVSSAESQVHLAESNLRRYSQLYEEGAVAQMTYEQYRNAYEVALAASQQASAQYAQGSNQLGYSLLYADKSGVISAIKAEIGQIVSNGQTVITIVQDGDREVEISIPENRIKDLQLGQELSVTFWALPNTMVIGKVREIAPMADPATRTYNVRVSLPNPPPEIKLGMTATVALAGSSNVADSIDIPLTSVYQNGDTPSVWVVDGDIVILKPVKLGQMNDKMIQVLDGLQQGERIVANGVHKLRQGQTVKVGDDSL